MMNFPTIFHLLVMCWTVVDVVLAVAAEKAATTTGFPPPPTFATKTLVNATNVTGNESTTSPETAVESPISSSSSSNQTIVNDVVPDWKRRLPHPLNNKTQTLQRIVVPGHQQQLLPSHNHHDNRTTMVEIYLLGTAHVSIDSSRDVRLLLEAVQPDIIFLELCDQRIPMLVISPPTPVNNVTTASKQTEKVGFWKRLLQGRKRKRRNQQSENELEELDMDEQNHIHPKSRKSMYSVAASLLTNMQQDYAQSLGVELGGEFRVAYQYWDETCKAYDTTTTTNNRRVHMILGDRPLYLTLTRAWESLRLWGKTKLLVGLLLSSFQRPDPKELQEWMQSILLDDSGDHCRAGASLSHIGGGDNTRTRCVHGL
jgi:hypothetical protein